MAVVEYTILMAIAIWGLVEVLQHHPGTYPITRQWFSLSGIGGKGSLASGLLIAVFIYSGWDGTLYVNEEVKHRRANPGKAAVYAVIILTAIYILTNLGLSGSGVAGQAAGQLHLLARLRRRGAGRRRLG